MRGLKGFWGVLDGARRVFEAPLCFGQFVEVVIWNSCRKLSSSKVRAL